MTRIFPLLLGACAAAQGSTGEGTSEDPPPVEVYVTVEMEAQPVQPQVVTISHVLDADGWPVNCRDVGYETCCPEGWDFVGLQDENGDLRSVCLFQ